MQKINLATTVAILLFTTATCFVATAGENDYSGKSVEELLSIRQQIDAALAENGAMTVIPYGQFVVGTDIAPGSYECHIYRQEDGEGHAGVFFTIWNSPTAEGDMNYDKAAYLDAYYAAKRAIEDGEDAEYPEPFNKYDYYSVYDEVVESGNSYRFTLEEGQVLVMRQYCEDVYITIEEATGLFME